MLKLGYIMHVVYVLQSERDQGWYIGQTSDLEARLSEHRCGRVKSTRARRPLKLIYTQKIINGVEAKKAEKYYKSGAGRAKLKILIDQTSEANL